MGESSTDEDSAPENLNKKHELRYWKSLKEVARWKTPEQVAKLPVVSIYPLEGNYLGIAKSLRYHRNLETLKKEILT
jgi:hypothetical protein